MPGTLGLRKPKLSILGADLAGEVESVGKDVTAFRPGDEVFAMLEQDGFAEYVCVPERELAPKPKNLSFEQTAAVPMAANTALLGLRDEGRIQPGQKISPEAAGGTTCSSTSRKPLGAGLPAGSDRWTLSGARRTERTW